VKSKPLLSAHPRIKRKRGGQPGNQNARKHGFYSSSMNPDEVCQFWNTVNQQGVEAQVAALVIKLRSLFEIAPGNRRAISEASKLLGKWYSVQHHLNKPDSRRLTRLILDLLLHRQLPSPRPPFTPKLDP
jgi:hypothetical protein